MGGEPAGWIPHHVPGTELQGARLAVSPRSVSRTIASKTRRRVRAVACPNSPRLRREQKIGRLEGVQLALIFVSKRFAGSIRPASSVSSRNQERRSLWSIQTSIKLVVATSLCSAQRAWVARR